MSDLKHDGAGISLQSFANQCFMYLPILIAILLFYRINIKHYYTIFQTFDHSN